MILCEFLWTTLSKSSRPSPAPLRTGLGLLKGISPEPARDLSERGLQMSN